jgi:Superfamily I DNA and RNA helicases
MPRVVADLHIHSSYSLATSPRLDPEHLDRWARIKGLGLLGTGDCSHPKWLAELEQALEPAGEGLFALKEERRREFDRAEALAEGLPEIAADEERGASAPRFALSGEICTIYSRGGRTRKVHHLVLLPSFEAAKAFQALLAGYGKIESDGRPILGIDSRDLFALLLEADDRSILIPAHIWTPWFSALGARSGFDSIEDCYGELAGRIPAIETGLSSNPPMNWALSSLDRFSIISNSDAHSPEKLAREATILDMDLSYSGLARALSGGGVLGTIEFFPQEGKYHYDGHRACGVVLDPEESAASGGICPVCGKSLTPGVLGRVRELADRAVDEYSPCPEGNEGTNKRPYSSLIPLKELLAELLESGEGSRRVAACYAQLIASAGSELGLLMERSLREIEALRLPALSGELLATAIGNMRSGKVHIAPGYDGEYGVIRAFAPGEARVRGQEAPLLGGEALFGDALRDGAKGEESARGSRRGGDKRGLEKAAQKKRKSADTASDSAHNVSPKAIIHLEPAQEEAISHRGGPSLVVAGPGTGKTAVLALRIERLVEGLIPGATPLAPESILALTFTNKAAGELRERLKRTIGEDRAAAVAASTFHSFCLSILREHAAEAGLAPDFRLLDEEGREAALQAASGGAAKAKRLGAYVEARKRFLLRPGDWRPPLGPLAPQNLVELAEELGCPAADPEMEPLYRAYRDELRREAALDFDDLIAGAARLLSSRAAVLEDYKGRFSAIFIDEYQDLNYAQYAFARILAPAPDSDIFAIGDPNQAIYGFRGSDKRLIDRFALDYPEAKVFRLTRSFRCAPDIIDAASGVVSAETAGAGSSLEGSGSSVALARSEYPSGASEAEAIARKIDELIGGTRFFARDSGVVRDSGVASDSGVADSQEGSLRSLAECAVLTRAAALLEPVAKALNDHGIPYAMVGEERQAPYEIRTERVQLMTIHAAKGLEFDYVFIAALEEGLLPFTLYDSFGDAEAPESAGASEARIEEEARILYVAMTRARIGLRLSWAKTRDFKGRALALPPSRFLSRLADLVPLEREAPRRPRDPQLGLF